MGDFKIFHTRDWETMSVIERAFYNYEEEYTTMKFGGEELNILLPSLTKIRRWIEKECEGEVVVIIHQAAYSRKITFCFEEESDAPAFKLAWM